MWDDLYFVNSPKLWPHFIFSALCLLSILFSPLFFILLNYGYFEVNEILFNI